MMSDQSTNDFEGREGVSGDAQPTQPPQPPTGESEQTTGASGAEGAATGAKVGADDFRDALSNLSSALDRFGRAAEARARQEWAQGKPEINRATDEIRKGIEGLVRKSSDAVDSLSRKLGRDEKAAPTAEATATESSASGETATTPAEPESPATGGTTPQ